MIIAEIAHGLGNQLFQYAAARRLAYVHQTILKLDLNAFARSKFRRYGLNHFNINAEIASWRDVVRLCPMEACTRAVGSVRPRRVSHLVFRILNKAGLKSPYRWRTDEYAPDQPLPKLLLGRVASERFFHFDSELLKCPDEICLSGYWQSEKYFKDISEIIRKELTVKTALAGKNLEVAQQISNANSVSLHIRRGDKATQSNHCATSAGYCTRAMEFFKAKLTKPKFFVFSDDWEWTRNNLPGTDDLIFVDHNDDQKNYEDLRLMSLCKYNIIAASSFSWWGAWLNNYLDKLVVRPSAWAKINNLDQKDVFPNDWIVIE